jgi:beta-glucosidase/6-phospho-beta-glucosidase/beta-galactosidase
MDKETFKNLYCAFMNLNRIHKDARILNVYDFIGLNYYSDIIENIEKTHQKEFNEIKKHIFKMLNVGWVEV